MGDGLEKLAEIAGQIGVEIEGVSGGHRDGRFLISETADELPQNDAHAPVNVAGRSQQWNKVSDQFRALVARVPGVVRQRGGNTAEHGQRVGERLPAAGDLQQ